MTIPVADYNKARAMLAQGGSDSARKAHVLHNTKVAPLSYGQQLLRESRDEFRRKAQGRDQRQLRSGMLPEHHEKIRKAAEVMGVTVW